MFILQPEQVRWITGGVSAIVASHDGAGRPSIVRAVGLAVQPDGTQVTLLLRQDQSRPLLADLQAHGPIAVVFSQPSTNRTLQLKATRATLRPALPTERAAQPAYVAAMQREIGTLGYNPAFVAALLHVAAAHALMAVCFAPDQAFEQTPGPHAGTPLTRQGDGA